MNHSQHITMTLEKDQISRLCIARRNKRTTVSQSLCGLSSQIPSVSTMIDHIGYKSGTVKSRRGISSPYIRDSQIFLSFPDHPGKFFIL